MKTESTCARLTLALLAAVGLAFSGCHLNFSMVDGYMFTNTGETAQSTEEGKFSESINAIDVVNKFGNVKIELAVGEPGWRWDAKVWADSQEMADLLIDELAMDTQITGQTQTWRVVLPEPTSDLNGVESNLTLMLPANVKVKLVNSHGNVSAAKIYADVTLENGHGNVELTELPGNVNVTHSHGDLVANHIGTATIDVRHGDTDVSSATGEISISNAHGDIKATGLMGDVNANNSHGSTRISASGQNVTAKATHGRIDLLMTSSDFKSIDIETSHASIKVELSSTVNPEIDMETTHGDSNSEFGSVIGSSQMVKLRTSHGDIRVRKKEPAVEVSQ